MNALDAEWQLSWEFVFDADQRNALETFLEEQGGYKPFLWRPFGAAANERVVCPAWAFVKAPAGVATWRGSATFVLDHGY